MSDEMHRRDMLMIKDMGANFIRISHYPQDEAILEQCDKLGILAWEEIPVIDIVPDSPQYADVAEKNLREMIRQHYNHPSIIMANIWEVMRPVKAGQPESVPLWNHVTLPHCFNAEDAVDPDLNYYQGAGWYRTNIQINNPYKGGRILLEFEGAGQQTDVYVYTTKVASHTGGYDGWVADITDAVKSFTGTDTYKTQFKEKVPIAVRCDNSRNTERIPSSMVIR